MRSLLQDLRYAARILVKNPGFSALAVVTLALGIGANTGIFSLVRGVLLRELPFRDAQRLVQIQETVGPTQRNPVSYPNFLDWQSQAKAFEGMAAYSNAEFILDTRAGSERLFGETVSQSYFPLLGVQPALGRAFLPAESESPLTHPVAIISNGLWQRVFGSDPSIIGKEIRLNNADYTVIGVAPRTFRGFSDDSDAWIPIAARDLAWPETAKFDFNHNRDVHWLKTFALLKPSTSLQSASAEMDTIAANLRQAYPKDNKDRGAIVRPAADHFVGDVRAPLLVLFGAVGLVLLIACANVVNLLLTRTVARHREIALRLSLGATTSRLGRQLLTETLLLTFAGAIAGIVLAAWGLDALVRLLPTQFPSFASIHLDRSVLLFSCGLAGLTGVLLAVVPVLGTLHIPLADVLKEGAKGSGGQRGRKLGGALVASEVALCLILLIGAGLLLQSVTKLLSSDPGFQPNRLLTMRFYVPKRDFAPGAENQIAKNRFGPALAESISNVPGVKSAAVTFIDPFIWGGFSRGFTIEGRSPLTTAEQDELTYQEIGPNFFATMGIPLKDGRDFTMQDDLKSPGRVLVNEAFARRYWPGENPVGKRLKYGPADSHYAWMEVIGVAGNSKFESLRQNADASPVIYGALLQSEVIINMSIVVRTQADPATMIGPLRAAIQQFDSAIPVYNIATINDRMRTNVAEARSYSILLALFAALALVLGVIGIYGVISYWVTQRTQEMGIRMALGARAQDVLSLVVREGLTLMALGVAAGIVGALVVARALRGMLFGISAADPATYIVLALGLLAVGALAAYVPARRATRVDPMIALRYE